MITPTFSRIGVYGIAMQHGPHAGKFDVPGGCIEAGKTYATVDALA